MNLASKFRIYQGQPFFKNSHMAHSILAYQNQQIILCTNQNIFVFSLTQMVYDQASLLNMISLQKIFPSKAEHCMDPITSIFNKSQKQKLGQKLFLDQNDISTNILMKGQFLKERLIYLNDIRLKNIEISVNGDLVICLCDGRALLIKRLNNSKYLKQYQIIDLNKKVKQKVKSVSFANSTLLVVHTYQKILVLDFFKDSQKFLTKIPIDLKRCDRIMSFCVYQNQNDNNNNKNQDNQQSRNNEEQLIILVQFSNKIQFFQVVKKSLFLLDQINSQQYINNIFIYSKFNTIFYSSASNIFKITIPQVKLLQKPTLKLQRSKSKDHKKQKVQFHVQKTYSFENACQTLFIDCQGNYILKQKTTNKQYIHTICQTENGFFLALTSKRNGNYKQGRIIVGSLSYEHSIRRLCLNIRNCSKNNFINCEDIKLLTEAKQKKQITNLISSLYKQYSNSKKEEEKMKNSIANNSIKNIQANEFQKLIQKYDGITLFDININFYDFQVLAINIGHIFEAKEASKHKLIQKRLKSHFTQTTASLKDTTPVKNKRQSMKQESLQKSQFQYSYKYLQNLCMISHQLIGQEDVFECKCCLVFAIAKQIKKNNSQYTPKCYICYRKMEFLA